MELHKPTIVAAFLSWLQYEAHLSKSIENIWVVRMHESDTIEIMHTNVFTAVLHGMTGFKDDEWRFDAIEICLGNWCDSVSDEYTSNISIHVKEWGPLVLEDIQSHTCIAVLQTLDAFVHGMAELILEYPDEYEFHCEQYMLVLHYQSIIKMPSYACMAA